MDNGQYRSLMYHLFYVESLMENISEVNVPKEMKCKCPICNKIFPAYLPFGEILRKNAMCPNCKSLERHRALWLLMQQMNWHKKGMSILHFAPEGIFYNLFASFKDTDYWPVDLEPDRYKGMVKKAVDITKIPFEDNNFDLIMCNHVLEHIPDDRKAMRELYRVLKPKTGIAFLNVPIFNISETLEKPEYNTPELRFKYYGQHDHVRAYGLDYPQRLREIGFSVQLFTMDDIDEKAIRKYGLMKDEKVFLCRKE